MQLKPNKQLTSVELISKLFHSRTQVHIFHLQTNSYAAHKALDEFYNGVLDFADSIAEALQGKEGILKGYKSEPFVENNTPIPFLEDLKRVLEAYRTSLPTNYANIDNEVQSLITLVDTTIYKLKFLK